jgi:hypothetical protein
MKKARCAVALSPRISIAHHIRSARQRKPPARVSALSVSDGGGLRMDLTLRSFAVFRTAQDDNEKLSWKNDSNDGHTKN